MAHLTTGEHLLTLGVNVYERIFQNLPLNANSPNLICNVFRCFKNLTTLIVLTGMRVGAKAVECLSLLKEARAVRFYRDYPKV